MLEPHWPTESDVTRRRACRCFTIRPSPAPYPRVDSRARAPGPVGILAAQCAKFRGAARVIVIDEHAYRLVRRHACTPRICRAAASLCSLCPPLLSLFLIQQQVSANVLRHNPYLSTCRYNLLHCSVSFLRAQPVFKRSLGSKGVDGVCWQAHVRKVVPGTETINFREARPLLPHRQVETVLRTGFGH